MAQLGKVLVFFLLLLGACGAAALFGALHNQVSYTVGSAYFTGIKFPQFGISESIPARLGAAWVGVQASWWMGFFVGLPAFLLGLFTVPQPRTYFAAGLGAVLLVLVFSTLAALAGLVGGIVADQTRVMDSYLTIPAGLDRSEFLRAAFMHDASYLGGALGALIALLPMRRARRIDLEARRVQTRVEGQEAHHAT